MYFKNSGAKAGASLLHPHSQIVALPIVPVEVDGSGLNPNPDPNPDPDPDPDPNATPN